MLKLLTHCPRPHTIMEWLLSTYIEPAYAVAQQTGLLAALKAGQFDCDVLAQQLQLSQRGTRAIRDVLVASGVLERKPGLNVVVRPENLRPFSATTAALGELGTAASFSTGGLGGFAEPVARLEAFGNQVVADGADKGDASI